MLWAIMKTFPRVQGLVLAGVLVVTVAGCGGRGWREYLGLASPSDASIALRAAEPKWLLIRNPRCCDVASEPSPLNPGMAPPAMVVMAPTGVILRTCDMPSAMYRYFCCASRENVMSQTEPEPRVCLLMNISLTNLPSFWKTWIRSLARSQT